MFKRIRALIIKELQALLNDPQGRQLLIMPVILQTALFPFAVTLDVQNNTLAVLNQDAGPISVELMQRFARAEAFTHFVQLHSEEDIRQTIDNQNALLVIYFPTNFSRDVLAGRPSTLQTIVDGRRSNSGQIANGYIQTIVQSYNDERANMIPGQSAVSQLVVRNWFNPNLDYKYFVLPCLVAIITTISVLVVTSLSIAREKEQGTFEQLLVSPLTPGMIMVGKAVPAVMVAVVQGTLIMLAAVFIYRVPFEGSLILLYISMVCYALSLAGFGLLISSICSSQQQAFLGVFSFMMPAVLLSGYAAPVDNMPGWLQVLTFANPLRHFIVIVKSIFLKGSSTLFVLENLWPLILIAIVTLSAANWMFRRQIA
ncbi:MAG TPA: ABC transporter permease [Candidatus Methylacidiphilales bacterium]